MTQIIVLALDGEAILLKNITVSVTMRLPDKDLSGQASSTTAAEQGDKAKELRISGLVQFVDESILKRLFQLAQARGANGAKKRYRIANMTAEAVNMRQGVFSGGIDATEQRDKMAWQVTFTLKEQMSVPEKTSARSNAKGKTATQQQTANGNGDAPPEDETPQSKWAIWMNKVAGKGLDLAGIGAADSGKDEKQ